MENMESIERLDNATSDLAKAANAIVEKMKEKASNDVQSYNVGESNYAEKNIQPWDIWAEYKLDPWRADIVKRVLRTKEGQGKLDLEKIIHICRYLLEKEYNESSN
jgi:hypothetical protein